MQFTKELSSPILDEGSHFRWSEALYLPRWRIFAVPGDPSIEDNIRRTASKLELIRAFVQRPLIVTSWFRPQAYNEEIGGARNSAHLKGLACDFIVKDCLSQDVRPLLVPFLTKFNVRMEDAPTPHIHIDLRCAKEMTNLERYFKVHIN